LLHFDATILHHHATILHLHVNLGWFIKSIHHGGAAVMVLFLVLHITRVYLTGALIWITGIMVASRTVGFGVSGYSLAWDQVAFW
jgi:quinol-cytochrome oxidoreductase complex cytochrome b subunit